MIYNNKLIKDIIINIISVLIPMICLQIIVLPIVANKLGAIQYGNIILLISIFTIISFPLGNTINNIRLIKDDEYKISETTGDFNIIVFYSLFIAILITGIYSFFFIENSIYNKLLFLIIIILGVLKEYYIVSYRLSLSFNRILMNNLYLTLGYLSGLFVFIYTNYWEYIFIIGMIFSLIYILKTTTLIKEPFKKTSLFKGTLVDSLYLYIASLLKNIINHADKILLFPLLGPTNVAIYYTANIIGKMLSMFVSPINSVVLSNLVKVDKKIKISIQIIMASLVGFLFYVLIVIIGPIILYKLYPDWAIESSQILKYTAASSVITAISGLFQPFNLRFNKMKWQLYINGSYIIIYMILTIILTNLYGLIGFSMGVLLSSIYNLLIQIFIYRFTGKK